MTAGALERQAARPGNSIIPRDHRFVRKASHCRGSDPVASAWFTALSASFPRGEAMFVDAVKAHREGVPPRLAEEIRAFIRQEVNHSREHVAFNRMVSGTGYDLAGIDRRVAALVADAQSNPPIVQLAITMALEHFTAMFAHAFLRDPEGLASAGISDRSLWLWHAAEEIEHKGVAFDTWLHATRHWPGRRRWLVRSLVMLKVTVRFLRNRCRDALELLAQDGMCGWKARAKLAAYLTVRPGILRRIIPAWLAYFRPGFHPWDKDDRDLIALWENEYVTADQTGA